LSVASGLVKLVVVASTLAIYDVFLRGAYVDWIEQRGEVYGFGQGLLVYMLVIGLGWAAGSILARRVQAAEN
jgi:hypothetical protein